MNIDADEAVRSTWLSSIATQWHDAFPSEQLIEKQTKARTNFCRGGDGRSEGRWLDNESLTPRLRVETLDPLDLDDNTRQPRMTKVQEYL